MSTQFSIEVRFDGPRIEIELPANFYARLMDAVGARSVEDAKLDQQVGASALLPLHRSERELLADKQPNGHSEIVAVLAYCLREAGKPEFTPDDIRRGYLRAAVKPPKVIAQALRDAKNKYDLIETGSKKGTFRLSPHGERTILFDLPRPKR
jgi:hypothetical protein